jgi:hypothetical protein
MVRAARPVLPGPAARDQAWWRRQSWGRATRAAGQWFLGRGRASRRPRDKAIHRIHRARMFEARGPRSRLHGQRRR